MKKIKVVKNILKGGEISLKMIDIRKVDELHRLVIPVDVCKKLGIEALDPIEIFLDENKIILRKH